VIKRSAKYVQNRDGKASVFQTAFSAAFLGDLRGETWGDSSRKMVGLWETNHERG
jgi:hypothetical protein